MSVEAYLDSLYSNKPVKKVQVVPLKKMKFNPVETSSPSSTTLHPIEESMTSLPPLAGTIQDLFRRHHLHLNSRRYNNDDAYDKQVFDKVIPLDNFHSGKPKRTRPAPATNIISNKKAKETCLYDLSKTSYESALILHKLWTEYVSLHSPPNRPNC